MSIGCGSASSIRVPSRPNTDPTLWWQTSTTGSPQAIISFGMRE